MNPQVRSLSYERILGSDCGVEAMETIREEEVSVGRDRARRRILLTSNHTIPHLTTKWQENVTLVVAGGTGPRGSVCDKESLEKMKRRLRGCDYLVVEGAKHSIHKTHSSEFGGILDLVCKQVAD